MISTFTCQHCGKVLPRNPRVKNRQKYCSGKACQQARKQKWDKIRYNSDRTYKHKRLSSQKSWRKKYPSHAYQRGYRERHPEYENRNRELQRNRNEKRKKSHHEGIGDMIVNTDALFTQTGFEGTYALMQVTKEGKIVNTDALMVRMQVLSEQARIFASKQS